MIESISIKNFKSFGEIHLEFGKLNVFIGTNASGKSNFFDALRVLQGMGNGFTIGEILDGKPKSATSEVWEGIRGGSSKAIFEKSSSKGIVLAANIICGSASTIELPHSGIQRAHFGSSFFPLIGRILDERLSWQSAEDSEIEIYSSLSAEPDLLDPAILVHLGGKDVSPLKLESHRPILTQIAHESRRWDSSISTRAAQVAAVFSNMQRLDPHPSILRGYSQAQQVRRMGDSGENFAALVRTILGDPETKDAYLTWLRHLRPAEVDDVGILTGAIGEPMFMLKEGGKEFPAPVLSDGTLRFAAITAAFFQPDMPGIMTIEEIENGIHASRLRLLVELLKNRAAEGKTQIMVTTHSPVILDWLDESDHKHVFFCKRDEETGESRIVPLTEIPHFAEAAKTQSVGDLFAEGWLETAL